MRIALACLTLFCTVPALAQPDTGDAEYLARLFCQQQSNYDQSALAPHLSPALAALIEKAWAANAAYEAQYPGDKPPLGDGIPWQSWPDAAPLCIAQIPAYDRNTAVVDIDYDFPDQPDASWRDQLVLVRIDSRWLIDDVMLQGDEKLTAILRSVITEADP